VIQIENLSKRYSDQYVAVDSINLQVPRGSFFGFLGSNGAGKTTTIKMMTGLLKPTEGSVRIGGYDIVKKPLEAKRLFAYIPDRPNLYEKLTAREFVQFMAGLYGVRDDVTPLMNELFERFDLSGSADKLIQSYSHGMKQKTAIIGALIHDPELIILDEPTVGLDPQGAKMLKDLLQERVQQGKTVFMCTHILELAERICDQIAILRKGHVIATGSVSDIMSEHGRNTLEEAFFDVLGG